MRSSWIRKDFNPTTWVLIWEKDSVDTQTCPGRISRDERGGGWSDVSPSPGIPKTASEHQKLERGKGKLPPDLAEGTWPFWYTDVGLPASRTVEEYTPTVWSHQLMVLCSSSFRKPMQQHRKNRLGERCPTRQRPSGPEALASSDWRSLWGLHDPCDPSHQAKPRLSSLQSRLSQTLYRFFCFLLSIFFIFFKLVNWNIVDCDIKNRCYIYRYTDI